MKQIIIFQGVESDDIENDINEWVKYNKIDVVDVKVNTTLMKDNNDWFTITVVYNK